MISFFRSAKGADARRQTTEELAGSSGGAPNTATVLREFFNRLFRTSRRPDAGEEASLTGAPRRVRWKTYSAENGYVYQYVYRGYRTVSTEPAREFVFELKLRAETTRVGVQISHHAVAECEQQIARSLLEQEKYALAKLSLFAAFDSGSIQSNTAVVPSAADMLEFLRTLGRL